jgi:hypothetical protein
MVENTQINESELDVDLSRTILPNEPEINPPFDIASAAVGTVSPFIDTTPVDSLVDVSSKVDTSPDEQVEPSIIEQTRRDNQRTEQFPGISSFLWDAVKNKYDDAVSGKIEGTEKMTPSQARRFVVESGGYGPDAIPEIADMLVFMGSGDGKSVRVFDEVEDATNELGSEVPYYLKPVGTMKYGTFMNTNWKEPTYRQGLEKIVEDISQFIGSDEVERYVDRQLDVLEAYAEVLPTGALKLIEGLALLPIVALQYVPRSDEAMRMAIDALWKGAPFKGVETYQKRIESEVFLKGLSSDVREYFEDAQNMLTRTIGSKESKVYDYFTTRVLQTATSFYLPIGSFSTPYNIIRSAIGPRGKKLIEKSVEITGNLNLSAAIVKAKPKNVIPRSTMKKIERNLAKKWMRTSLGAPIPREFSNIDSTLGGALAFETTLTLLADSNFKYLVAFPMLIAGIFLSPGRMANYVKVKHQVGAVPKALFNFRNYMYNIGDALYAHKPKDRSKLQRNFLAGRGLEPDQIQKIVNEGRLGIVAGAMSMGRRAHKDLQGLKDSFINLEKTNPAAHAELLVRYTDNMAMYDELAKLANAAIPATSKQVVDVYLNNLLEISYFEVLLKHGLAMREGMRFSSKKLPLYFSLREMQANMQLIKKANVDLMKSVRNDIGIPDSSSMKEFVSFATRIDNALSGSIEESSKRIQSLLSARKIEVNTAKEIAKNNLEIVLTKHSPTGTPAEKAALQTNTIRDAFFKDQAEASKFYNDIDLDTRLGVREVTEFKDFVLSKLTPGGSEALKGKVPYTVMEADPSPLANVNVPESSVLDAIDEFAGLSIKGTPLRKINNQLILKTFEDNNDAFAQNMLMQADDHIGRVRQNADGTPFDYASIPKADAINQFMRIKDEGLLTLIPVNMTIRQHKNIMSKLGKIYADNIGNIKGHTTMEFMEQLEKVLDSVPENISRTVLGYKAARNIFKTEFVPRWKRGIGSIFMKTVKSGSEKRISDEAIFKTYFSDIDKIVERSESLSSLLYTLRSASVNKETGKMTLVPEGKRENYEATIKLVNFGLLENLPNMTSYQISKIVGTYGKGSNLNILHKDVETSLINYGESLKTGALLSRKNVENSLKELSSGVENLTRYRQDTISKSVIRILSKTEEPGTLFTDKIKVYKSEGLTASEIETYSKFLRTTEGKDRLVEAVPDITVQKGITEDIGVIAGKPIPEDELTFTAFEAISKMTNNFKGHTFEEATLLLPKGSSEDAINKLVAESVIEAKKMQEIVASFYAHDIISSSIIITGKKITKMVFDSDGKQVQVLEEIIDSAVLTRKLDATKDIREKLLTPEHNAHLEKVLEYDIKLSATVEEASTAYGLARPFAMGNFMSRGFAIARGVLSLRYFAGELTIQRMRLEYVNMVKSLLEDPNAIPIFFEMITPKAAYKLTGLSFKERLDVLAKFWGIKASELDSIDEETAKSLILTGIYTKKQYDDAVKKGNEKQLDKNLSSDVSRKNKKFVSEISRELSNLMDVYQ